MIGAVCLVINLLEKLSLTLYVPILTQEEIDKGKKIITSLNENIQDLNENIDLLKISISEKKNIKSDQIIRIIAILNSIIRKYKKVDDLITSAAQTHVVNMEDEGYSDNE